MTNQPESPPKGPSRFEQSAGKNRSLVREVIGYLGQNKKWWLVPVVVTFVLIGALALLSSTAAAPFIYTLF